MEDAETQLDDETYQHDIPEEEEKPSKNVLTTEMVNSWCKSIREDEKLSAVHSLMKAFRTACHYGDDTGTDSSAKFSVMSSSVFNKIMLFTLSEMDRILRKLLKLPASGGKKETIIELMNTKQWKNYNHLVKSYLGNALHVLNQMTDTKMISFTLRRLQYSSVFLAALPSLLRKYIKVCRKGKSIRDFYSYAMISFLLHFVSWSACVCDIHISIMIIWGLIYSSVDDIVLNV